jgi:hypothetical protein
MHDCDRLPVYVCQLRSGWASPGRRWPRSRKPTESSCARYAGEPVLRRLKGSIEDCWRTKHPLGTSGRLGRHLLRSSRSSVSVLANAAIYLREGTRWPLRRRLHLRRKVLG